jgi:hypothetical protein
LSLTFISCDILRNGIFEVRNWSPGDGYHDPLSIEVALVFSLEPNRNSVERSFSLSEDGRALHGHFSWQGNRMIFCPGTPLSANKDYLITLKTEAQDVRGLNLEQQFEAVFTTRIKNDRPLLLSTIPEDGGIISENRGRVELLFSEPMNRSSLQNCSFSPSVSGVWSLEQDDCRAIFTPSENWNTARSYRLTIGALTASKWEKETGREYVLHLTAGVDRTPPKLLSAYALDPSGKKVMSLLSDNGTVAENARWERNYRLGLDFSKPIDSFSVSSALSMDPSLGMILETIPGFSSTLVYRFSDTPVFGETYTITLGKTARDEAGNTLEEKILWRIRHDGEYSRPPVLKGFRFPKNPNSFMDLLVYRTEDLFADFPVESKNYTFDSKTSTWLELYFETASGALIDPVSLMEKFRFSSTNGAVSFSPRSIIPFVFTVPDPVTGWENLCRMEIRGELYNHPYTGMVTIEIGTGLKDNLGNRSTETQRFLLLK